MGGEISLQRKSKRPDCESFDLVTLVDRQHNFIRMALRGLLLFLFYFVTSDGFALSGEAGYHSADKPLTSIASLGKRWHMYVNATVYDVLLKGMCERDVCVHLEVKNIRRFINSIPYFTHGRYPCSHNIFAVGALGLGDLQSLLYPGIDQAYGSKLDVESTLCGTVHASLKPTPRDQFDFKSTNPSSYCEWHWLLHAHESFIFNVTFISFDVKAFSARFHLSLLVLEDNVTEQFHPGYLKSSYFSKTNRVALALSTENPYSIGIIQTTGYSYAAEFIIQYQIRDRDFEVTKHYHIDWYKPISGQHVTYTGVFPDSVIKTWIINTLWGKAVDALWENLTCSVVGTRLLFYDLPVASLFTTDHVSDYLGEWTCPKFSNNTQVTDMRSTIGDLSIVIISTRSATISDESFELVYSYREPDAKVITYHNITLTPYTSTAQLSIPPANGKYLHNVRVISAHRMFVRFLATKFSYMGYTSFQCMLGGIMFYSRYHATARVCANKTAEYLTKFSQSRGITVGRKLELRVKQYGWLSDISAELIFHVDICVGYINVIPRALMGWSNLMRNLPYVSMARRSYQRFSFYYDMRTTDFIQIFRPFSLCIKLQVVFFDLFGYAQARFMESASARKGYFGGDLLYKLESIRLVSTSHFLISFSYVSEEIQFAEECMYNGFRIFLNNRNDEPFIFLDTPSAEPQSVHGHQSVMRLFWLCIRYGGAFSITTIPSSVRPVCLTEIGELLAATATDIPTTAACGNILLGELTYSQGRSIQLDIYRPLEHPTCCYYDALFDFLNTSCIKSLKMEDHRVDMQLLWEIHNSRAQIIRWRDMCYYNNKMSKSFGRTFSNACFYMTLDMISLGSCPVRLNYRVNLIDHYSHEHSVNLTREQYKEICLGSTCYITPVTSHNLTWQEAQKACKEEDSLLASVNSHEEWHYIIGQHHTETDRNKMFLDIAHSTVFFIGLHSSVSMIIIYSKTCV